MQLMAPWSLFELVHDSAWSWVASPSQPPFESGLPIPAAARAGFVLVCRVAAGMGLAGVPHMLPPSDTFLFGEV